MTKAELVRSVAEKANLTRDEASRAITALSATIAEQLLLGGRVPLQGVGSLSVLPTAARTVRHPRTRKVIQVPAGRRVRFLAVKELKEIL